MRLTSPSWVLPVLLLVSLPARSQNVNLRRPPEIHVQKVPSVETMKERMQKEQLQNDVKELGELCSAVSADMEAVKQGLLQKDAISRLKRIEKLSKRLREELTQ